MIIEHRLINVLHDLLEFSFIKQKLSAMISQDSSGSAVKDVGVRYGGPWFELW